MQRAALVRVVGRVQGVSFRYYTRQQALQEGLHGWVRNLANGDVQVWLQGEAGAVARMLQWLHQGPPSARVDLVEISACDPDPGFGTFEIRH